MENEKLNSIGKRIEERRKELGLTQKQLGDSLGITDKAISKWESDKGMPDIAYIASLAKELNTTTDYLLTGSGDNHADDGLYSSPMERCAKRDDETLLDAAFINDKKDENMKSFFDYICDYESVRVFQRLMKEKKASRLGNFYDFVQAQRILFMSIISNSVEEMQSNNVAYFNEIDKDRVNKFFNQKLLRAIFCDKRVTEDTLKYLFQKNRANNRVLWLFYLKEAIKFKNWKALVIGADGILETNKESRSYWEKREPSGYYRIGSGPQYITVDREVLVDLLKNKQYEIFEKLHEENKIDKGVVLTEKEICDIKAEYDSNLSKNDVALTKALNFDVLNFRKLMNECSDCAFLVKALKEKCITYFEYIIKNYKNKNNKALIKFAVDAEFPEFLDAVIANDERKIYEFAFRFAEYPDRNTDEKMSKMYSWQTLVFEEEKPTNQYGMYRNTDRYNGPRFSGIRNPDELLKEVDAIRNAYIDRFDIKTNNEAKRKDGRDPYLQGILEENDIEKFAIKACVTLETLFKNNYGYVGTLGEMLDQYRDNRFLGNTHDYRIEFLYRLKNLRNNYVHGEFDRSSGASLSKEELQKCVDIISEMEGEKK